MRQSSLKNTSERNGRRIPVHKDPPLCDGDSSTVLKPSQRAGRLPFWKAEKDKTNTQSQKNNIHWPKTKTEPKKVHSSFKTLVTYHRMVEDRSQSSRMTPDGHKLHAVRACTVPLMTYKRNMYRLSKVANRLMSTTTPLTRATVVRLRVGPSVGRLHQPRIYFIRHRADARHQQITSSRCRAEY